MRMVNGADRELAAIDVVHYLQMLLRLHQESHARIARERHRVFGVHAVLDIGDRVDFLDRGFVVADEAAAFERELALSLCDDRIHARAAYRYCLHRWPCGFIIRWRARSAALTSRVSIRFVSALRPRRSASSTILPFSAS